MKEFELPETSISIFKHNNIFYAHKSDIHDIPYNTSKLRWFSDFYKITSKIKEEELKLMPTHLISEEAIELFFEINNLPSLLKKNKIKFGTFEDPRGSLWSKSKVYNNLIYIDKNELKIIFPLSEISLAIHVVFQKINNILIGNIFTLENEFQINEITVNEKKINLDEILTEHFLSILVDNNIITVKFDKNIAKRANLLLTIDDKYDYKKNINNFAL